MAIDGANFNSRNHHPAWLRRCSNPLCCYSSHADVEVCELFCCQACEQSFHLLSRLEYPDTRSRKVIQLTLLAAGSYHDDTCQHRHYLTNAVQRLHDTDPRREREDSRLAYTIQLSQVQAMMNMVPQSSSRSSQCRQDHGRRQGRGHSERYRSGHCSRGGSGSRRRHRTSRRSRRRSRRRNRSAAETSQSRSSRRRSLCLGNSLPSPSKVSLKPGPCGRSAHSHDRRRSRSRSLQSHRSVSRRFRESHAPSSPSPDGPEQLPQRSLQSQRSVSQEQLSQRDRSRTNSASASSSRTNPASACRNDTLPTAIPDHAVELSSSSSEPRPPCASVDTPNMQQPDTAHPPPTPAGDVQRNPSLWSYVWDTRHKDQSSQYYYRMAVIGKNSENESGRPLPLVVWFGGINDELQKGIGGCNHEELGKCAISPFVLLALEPRKGHTWFIKDCKKPYWTWIDGEYDRGTVISMSQFIGRVVRKHQAYIDSALISLVGFSAGAYAVTELLAFSDSNFHIHRVVLAGVHGHGQPDSRGINDKRINDMDNITNKWNEYKQRIASHKGAGGGIAYLHNENDATCLVKFAQDIRKVLEDRQAQLGLPLSWQTNDNIPLDRPKGCNHGYMKNAIFRDATIAPLLSTRPLL